MGFEAADVDAISQEEKHGVKIQGTSARRSRWSSQRGGIKAKRICKKQNRDTWASKRLSEVKTMKPDWVYWNSLVRAAVSFLLVASAGNSNQVSLRNVLVHIHGEEKRGARV